MTHVKVSDEEVDMKSPEEEKVDLLSEKSELGNPLYCSYIDGVYTYKDPATEKEFRWDDITKQWKPKGKVYSNMSTAPGSIADMDSDMDPLIERQRSGSSITSVFGSNSSVDGSNGGGFRNPNYDSSSRQSTDSQPRRFYYAALSPSEIGVNEPLLFLSPDDQVNNNSTISPPDDVPHQFQSSVRPREGLQHELERTSRTGGSSHSELLLPLGWERHEDSSGPYYWHIKSGTIQRDRPTSEQRVEGSANPALLIPGSLNSTSSLNPSVFRRSQTISSQLSSSSSFAAAPNNGFTSSKNQSLDLGRGSEVDSFLRREKGQGDGEKGEKRRSWSQFLPDDDNKVLDDRALRFGGVSLGSLSISEENLTPERSSRAVSKVIAELTTQGTGKGISSCGIEVAGRIWGGGSELYLELDEAHLRLRTKDRDLVVGEQAIHSIRVWGVGRDDPRDFAYVSREKTTRQFLCHVFRLEMSARPLASALRDACKKIMIERQQKQKRPTTLPTSVRTRGTSATAPVVPFFPTPMDEPRKIIKASYLGSTTVTKPTGMETLNAAIDSLRENEPLPVNISVAPSVLMISSDESDQCPKLDVEIRVRYLSFMGIGRDIETCGVIVHTARDDFQAHAFYSTPSTAALAKAIEAACVLRYQKCLDAHHTHAPEGTEVEPTEQTTSSGTTPSQKTGTNLAVALKNVLASLGRAKSLEEKT